MLRRIKFGNEQGVAAIELALLGPVFFGLLLVLIDISIFFGVHAIVDNAVENGARAIRLGILSAKDAGAGFRQALCSNLVLLDCDAFSFSVEPAGDLSKVETLPTIDANGAIVNPVYNPGGPEDVVVITIVYVHRFMIPYAGAIFGDDGLKDPFARAIVSFLVVKNEPFPAQS